MRIALAWHVQVVLLARRGLIHVLLALLLLQIGRSLGAVGVCCIALFDDCVGGAGANIISLCCLVVMFVVLITLVFVS